MKIIINTSEYESNRRYMFMKFRSQFGSFNLEAYRDLFTQAIEVYSYKYRFTVKNLETGDDEQKRFDSYIRQWHTRLDELYNNLFYPHALSPGRQSW